MSFEIVYLPLTMKLDEQTLDFILILPNVNIINAGSISIIGFDTNQSNKLSNEASFSVITVWV